LYQIKKIKIKIKIKKNQKFIPGTVIKSLAIFARCG